MNQAIHFPDREWWDEQNQAVCFPALVHGMLNTCAISMQELYQRFGQTTSPLALFQEHRWDLEEEAQACIMRDERDAQGWFWLSSAR